MLSDARKQLLEQLLAGASTQEVAWINGYLSGLLQRQHAAVPGSTSQSSLVSGSKGPAAAGLPAQSPAVSASTPASPTSLPASPRKLTLAYGTETGNAKKLAGRLAASAKKNGLNFRLTALDTYRFTELDKEQYFFVIISTQGEGEPPIPAKPFYEHVMQQSLALPGMQYSVLALGDTSYPLYCKTGEDVDAAFEKHGAKRVLDLQRCDVDYEADAAAWFAKVMELVKGATVETLAAPSSAAMTAPGNAAVSHANGAGSPVANGHVAIAEPVNGPLPAPAEGVNGLAPAPAAAKKPAGKKYYTGTIRSNIVLNDVGSEKQTYHIEIVTGEEIVYECGDTIGIVPKNRLDVVNRIIELSGLAGSDEVVSSKTTAPLEELLTSHVNICYLMGNTMKKYATITGHTIPDIRMDLIDLLRIYPVADANQFREVIRILLPISPRLYTVASSPSAHGTNEVHITVARDRFLAQDEQRYGLCSEFLGDQPIGSGLTFYVHREKNFKMPASPSADIIMIGPGTGIAPFRSFLAERDATGADGRNWLFFGERHFLTDFLYQSEIQAFVETGVLHKINLAFSRDQDDKVYVQHRMLANAAELYEWMENGAHVYISGTKDPMGKDVEACLLKIIAQEGHLTQEEAVAYLDRMDAENRYQKDVY